MNYIFVYEYSLIILINMMNLTNTNFLHPRLDTCKSTLFMYNSHVTSVINGYNISFPTKQTLYFLPFTAVYTIFPFNDIPWTFLYTCIYIDQF